MVNTVTREVINDGHRNYIVKVHINSDGTEETGLQLFDPASAEPPFDNATLWALDYSMAGNFQGVLMWEGTANEKLLTLSNDQAAQHDFSRFGGHRNTVPVGRTGAILLETTGIASTDEITLTLWMRKDHLTVAI